MTLLVRRWCSLRQPFGVTSATAPSSSRHPSPTFVSAFVGRNPSLPSSLSSSRSPSSYLELELCANIVQAGKKVATCCQ
ncbi:hypothetical protein PIB30_094332 [Stylosanthes scabra]|uniref:Uncharacterized protein n=1 Tax=Stylosanthes scabra TaxID=79078 RepID=A0ABU6UU92_9FABA|nr:hypothetical protein [Stylosanthes scabra]